MKKTIYFIVTAVLNIAAMVVFFDRINLVYLSLIPLFLIGVTLWQAMIFSSVRSTQDGRNNYATGNTARLTDEETDTLNDFSATCLLIAIPLYVPFIFFFPAGIKLLSIAVYFVACFGGSILFRLSPQGKNMRSRLDKEVSDLKAQQAREELGKMK